VNLKFIWDVVTRIRIGKKGKAYVVDATGHLVADPDIGLVLRKTDLSALEQVKAAFAPGADDTYAMLARDLAGNKVLTAYAPIEPAREQAGRGGPASVLGWKMFVEQPVSEVYAALDATILRTVALIVAGLLFSALTALWLARSMVRPINVLQEGAQRIGEGDLEQKIEIRTGDELEALAGQFNRMTEQLRESYSGLERKVEERTAELKETLDQQTATAEILQVISSSTSDVQPVFDAIVKSAQRLMSAKAAALLLRRESEFFVAAYSAPGLDSIPADVRKAPLDRAKNFPSRVILDGEVIHIPDWEARDIPEHERIVARSFGVGSGLQVPLLRDAHGVGALVMTRQAKGGFHQKEIALLRSFADQAVIAIENVRLFNETKESLEQQTATSQILRVISDSPGEVRPILAAVAERATRLCEASAAAIYVLEGEILRRAAFHGPAELEGRETLPYVADTLTGRTIADGKPIHIEDLERVQDEFPMTWELAQRFGRHQTMLAVPLMREGRPFGTMFLRRTEVRPFTEKQISLSKVFADQAAIGIENVRLFNETKEALEQQTATSEILRIISGSRSDLGAVFAAILSNATLLCEAAYGVLWQREGDAFRMAALHGALPADQWQTGMVVRPSPEVPLARVVQTRKSVHIVDMRLDAGYLAGAPLPVAAVNVAGMRTLLLVPMLKDNEVIGQVAIYRTEVRAFSERQIGLIENFADQAVIAIENVRLFNEIQEKTRQLEIANKHKSDFLANMSHELRTPLNAIIGFSEVLSERMFGEINEKQADYLKDIHESGRHLLSLINDILDLSKIEAGRMDLELSTFDLPAALSNAMTLVRERAQRHRIELSLEVDPRLGAFQADERKFKQIAVNLLSNAVKFTPDGGKVAVSAKMDTTHVEVAVKDTGIGIAPEDQAAVFEEFKQVGRDYTRKAEGTGLGLTLTKRFVELHGGEVRLESALGQGSTFTVTFPLR
jgi:signal transduction histidine kinase